MQCGRCAQKCLSLSGHRASLMAQFTCGVGDTGDAGSIPESGRFPWRRKMATHSSILAWRIPGTEEPGGLQSMRSQKVRHNWKTGQHAMEMGRDGQMFTFLHPAQWLNPEYIRYSRKHYWDSNMDMPGDDHTKSSQTKKLPYDTTFMGNLKYDTNEAI